ncbi:MAG: type I-E CRISPR-associated protein Cse2/CasB [Methylovulum sp.]|nr:MAG: type I-E CRISPR-associated protein Cse2/CasB [Methylovulum sp.]
MSEEKYKPVDFMALYQRYGGLGLGPQAELKRVMNPDDLAVIPAFYRVLQDNKSYEKMRRLMFCLPHIKHVDGGDSLGKALAKAEINEKRLFMVIRSQEPNDLIQLRRLLKQAKQPAVDWLQMANALWWWDHPNQQSKRQLLEDFFFYQNTKPQAST